MPLVRFVCYSLSKFFDDSQIGSNHYHLPILISFLQQSQINHNHQFLQNFNHFFTEKPNSNQPHNKKFLGYDLCSIDNLVIPARQKALVKTGIAVMIPEGNYGRIAPRSGLAWKNFIDTLAGVIDEDYRGEVKVLLVNLGDQDFEIKYGDRIAQFIIEKYTPTDIEVVEELNETNRGVGGFGSTGVQIQKKEVESPIYQEKLEGMAEGQKKMHIE